MKKSRKSYIQSCEISQVMEVVLGGYKQKIAIEGKSKNLPLVICLHGGPGSPIPFSVGCRGLFPEWTDKAIMVYWDQLGCGCNNHKIDDSFKVENFVDMTCDLVCELKNMFPENKLFLFGVSWGSILALHAGLRVHEKIDGVFVYGQVLKNLFFNGEVEAAFDSAPQKAKQAALKILEAGTDLEYAVLDKNLRKLHKLLRKYTNAFTNRNAPPAPVGEIIKGLLTSPDYSFKDFKAVVKNGYRYNKTLLLDHLNTDLTPLLSKVQVRYVMLQGDTDVITSTKNVLDAVEKCNNDNVSVRVIKDAGHLPSMAAMNECFNTLLQFIQ